MSIGKIIAQCVASLGFYGVGVVVRVGVREGVLVGLGVRVGEGVQVELGVTGVRVGEGVHVGRRVCVGIKVIVGRGVRVGEAVYVGRGVGLGVRVQLGIGVREAVGVRESMAMNVLFFSVQMANAVYVPKYAGVREGVARLVSVENSVAVSEMAGGWAEAWMGREVNVSDATGSRVRGSVCTGVTVETTVGERIWPMTGFPKKTDPKASSTSTTDADSHCQPARIWLRRVR
jgi:hypothetical protein